MSETPADYTVRCYHPDCAETWTLRGAADTDTARALRAWASRGVDADYLGAFHGTLRSAARAERWGELPDGRMICPHHNHPKEGFPSYTVGCAHEGCTASHTYDLYNPRTNEEDAYNHARITALAAGWGMASDSRPLCPGHLVILPRLVWEGVVAAQGSEQMTVGLNGRTAVLPLGPECYATARSFRAGKVRVIVEPIP